MGQASKPVQNQIGSLLGAVQAYRRQGLLDHVLPDIQIRHRRSSLNHSKNTYLVALQSIPTREDICQRES
jgi:hypothetical protein